MGSHPVAVAENITASYQREKTAHIFKCISAPHETCTSRPTSDLLVLQPHTSHIAIHTREPLKLVRLNSIDFMGNKPVKGSDSVSVH